MVLSYFDSVDTYSQISLASLPNSLLAFPRVAAGAKLRPNLDYSPLGRLLRSRVHGCFNVR